MVDSSVGGSLRTRILTHRCCMMLVFRQKDAVHGAGPSPKLSTSGLVILHGSVFMVA